MSYRSLFPVAVLVSALAAPLAAQAPDSVTFRGTGGIISQSVAIPAGRAVLITSGMLGPVVDSTAPAGTRGRYGDTKTQGIGIMKTLQKALADAGLTMKDVVSLRVFIAGDATKGGQFDFPGWNEAYGQFFNNPTNPTKPTRYVVGVAWLARPEALLEIDATAVYPK